MRYLAVLLLFFSYSFALPACAQKSPPHKVKTKKAGKKVAATPARTPPKREAVPVLMFERTPCFGTCPAYSMRVFADGRVVYEGRANVPVMGPKELKLPAATLAEMLHQAQEAHFNQFEEKYSLGATDMTTTVVAVRQPDGQLKTVSLESGAPENVRTFFAYLTKEFDALAQLTVDR